MIGLVIFVLILPVQVFAAGEDSSSENNRTEDNMTETDLEKTQEETEQKIWELTEVKDLDTAIQKLFPEEKLHFQDLVESVIRQDENLSAGQIRNFVTDQFFYVLKVNKPVLASIIFLVLIAAVFSNFSEVFQNCQISQTAFFLVCPSAVFLFLLIIVLHNVLRDLVERHIAKSFGEMDAVGVQIACVGRRLSGRRRFIKVEPLRKCF